MTAIAPCELSVAIRSNQIDLVKDYLMQDGCVKNYLERGGDANATFEAHVLKFDGGRLFMLKDTDVGDSHLTLLHIAVVNCWYKLHVSGILGKEDKLYECFVSLRVLHDLVEYGAQLHATARLLSESGGPLHSPLSLARVLKDRRSFALFGFQSIMMDSVVTKLVNVPIATAPVSVRMLIATVTVPKSTMATFKKLLFSADHSDVKFICKYGDVFPAHKAVLAACSPYFATAFQGPWAENSPDGEWKTSYASSIIKTVLSFYIHWRYRYYYLHRETHGYVFDCLRIRHCASQEYCSRPLYRDHWC